MKELAADFTGASPAVAGGSGAPASFVAAAEPGAVRIEAHHRDVIGVALRRLERDLEDEERNEQALADLDFEVRHH